MPQLLCPVCNGLTMIAGTCPQCGDIVQDHGPLQHLYGPYSAYRPIDDIKKSNGFPDLENQQCIHLTSCSQCNKEWYTAISEWKL